MTRYLFILFSSLLLISPINFAMAMPPSTPLLEVEIQGLSVEIQWDAVGASGYRLFYADPRNNNMEMADMGTTNRINATFEHGTTLSLFVQAYNTDGNSAYSEVKQVVIHDPAADRTSEQLGSQTQHLEFKAVFLDTPVTFLPTDEAIKVRERTVRKAKSQTVTYGPEFEDGRIAMTVHIAPTLVQRDALELALCLGLTASCEPLLVWNSEKQRYTETITIRGLSKDVEKTVYLELFMPEGLVVKLRGQPQEQQYTIYASNVKNPASQLVSVTTVPMVDLGAENIRSGRSDVPVKVTNQLFGKEFNNRIFGAKFTTTPTLWLYKTQEAEADKKSGAHLGISAVLTATVLENSFEIMKLEGYATKNSGKRLTRTASVNVLGIAIYDTQSSKRPGQQAQVLPTQDKMPADLNWQHCGELGAACSSPPSTGDEAEGGNEGDEASSLANIFSYIKSIEKEYSQVYVIAFSPVQLSLGIKGTAQLDVGAGVETISDPVGLKLVSDGGPQANIGGIAAARVTTLTASAGIEGPIHLLENSVSLNTVATLHFSPSDWLLNGEVTMQLNGPSGTVTVYAERVTPAWSLPPWKTKRVAIPLVSWESFQKNFTLLQWGEDGEKLTDDRVVLDTLYKEPATVSYATLPSFTEQEPAPTDTGWVCLYSSNATHTVPVYDNRIPLICNESATNVDSNSYKTTETAVSIRSCTKIPEMDDGEVPYQEIALNLSALDKGKIDHRSHCPPGSPGIHYQADRYEETWSSFVDNVTKLKIWGPLRVALFSGPDRSGSSAYWYANRGEVKEIDLTDNYMQGKSQSLLLTRIDAQDNQKVPPGFNICFYDQADLTGDHFCFPVESGIPSNISSQPDVRIQKEDIAYIGQYWDDKISSVVLTGYGVVCAYEEADFNGHQYCWLGQGHSFSFPLNDADNAITSLKIMSIPHLALVDNLNGGLEEAGSSSLPNGHLFSSGGLSGFYGNSINAIYHPNQASIAALKGPLTITLYDNKEDQGNRSTFYLDNDEWDVAYLHGIDNVVKMWKIWDKNCYQTGKDACASSGDQGVFSTRLSNLTPIRNRKTGQCLWLDVSQDNKLIQSHTCDSWQIGFYSDGYRIMRGNYYLNVENDSTENYANVTVNTYSGDQWELMDAGNGYYYIVNKNSGKCLSPDKRKSEADAALVQHTCFDDHAAQWQFSELTDRLAADKGVFLSSSVVSSEVKVNFINKQTLKCADISNENTAVSNYCHSNSFWEPLLNSDGSYIIQHILPRLCLVAGDNGQVTVDSCPETGEVAETYKWHLLDAGGGYYTVSSKVTGDCLNDSANSTVPCGNGDKILWWLDNSVIDYGSSTNMVITPVNRANQNTKIKNMSNGLCLSSPTLLNCNNPANVTWKMQSLGYPGWYQVTNEDGSKCLDNDGRLSPCAGQIWVTWASPGSSTYEIRNRATGDCLTYDQQNSIRVASCIQSPDRYWVLQ